MHDIDRFSASTPGAQSDKHLNDPGEAMLFESAILPAQFFASRRSNAEMEPERRLAFAVLADAVRCFQLNLGAQSRSKIREFAETQLWFFETTHDGPFSCENVCYLLEVQPADIRRALRQWQAMKVAGVSSPSRLRRSPVNRRKALYQKNIIRRAC